MTNYFETWKKMSETSMNSGRQLVEINTKTMEELGEQYVAVANLLIETGTQQGNTFGKSKGYKEAVAAQTDLTSDLSGKLMGIVRNTTDICSEHKEKYTAWYDNSVKENAAYVPSV